MHRTKFLATAALTAIALSGCVSAPYNSGQELTDERQAYPITVSPHMETLHVAFNGAGAMTPDQDAQLTAFAKDYLDKGNGAISVSVPGGDPEAKRYFAARLSDLGVPAWKILLGNDGASGAVEISYIRYAAVSPDCGDWSTSVADTASNLPPPNFGCATQHNIAAMVADPRDLVAARAEDPADAQRRMQIIDKYRKGQPTPSEKTPAQSAAISDVNKQ